MNEPGIPTCTSCLNGDGITRCRVISCVQSVGFLPAKDSQEDVSWVTLEESQPQTDISWQTLTLSPPTEQDNSQYRENQFLLLLRLWPKKEPFVVFVN